MCLTGIEACLPVCARDRLSLSLPEASREGVQAKLASVPTSAERQGIGDRPEVAAKRHSIGPERQARVRSGEGLSLLVFRREVVLWVDGAVPAPATSRSGSAGHEVA
jgi:hypothetical protein